LPICQSRRSNQIKGLPIIGFQAPALPARVRKYKIQKVPFLTWRLTFEQLRRLLGQLQQLDAFVDEAPVGRLTRSMSRMILHCSDRALPALRSKNALSMRPSSLSVYMASLSLAIGPAIPTGP
jgi:hypothetical protein